MLAVKPGSPAHQPQGVTGKVSRILEVVEITDEEEQTQSAEAQFWDEEAAKKREQIQELAAQLLGDEGKKAIGAIVPKKPKSAHTQEAKDTVQVRKAFQQAVLAKEKAEAAKAKADKDVIKVQQDLKEAKQVQQQVEEILHKAEQKVQQALEDCNKYIGKEEQAPPPDPSEQYLGEDPELQQMQKEILAVAQEQAKLLEAAKGKFTELLAKKAGQGCKKVLAEEAAKQGQRAAKQARKQAEGQDQVGQDLEDPEGMEFEG
jgi:hypothetical protein